MGWANAESEGYHITGWPGQLGGKKRHATHLSRAVSHQVNERETRLVTERAAAERDSPDRNSPVQEGDDEPETLPSLRVATPPRVELRPPPAAPVYPLPEEPEPDEPRRMVSPWLIVLLVVVIGAAVVVLLDLV